MRTNRQHATDRRTGTLLVAAILVLVALILGGSVWYAVGHRSDDTSAAADSATEVDRSDPNAVVAAYSNRFVAEDPLVCDLATSKWSIKLDNAGKCSGHVNPSDPKPSSAVRSLDVDATPPHAVVQAGPQKYGPGDACLDIDLVQDENGWSVEHSDAPLFNDDGAQCGA